MKKKIIIIIIALLVIIPAVVYYVTSSAAKLTEYEFDNDKVASINAVIGEERKVTDVHVGITDGGGQYKQYTYESASVVKDLSAYALYLRNNGWSVTQDYDLNSGKGEMQLATESADRGKILVMAVAFEASKYAIRLNKLEGTLTLN